MIEYRCISSVVGIKNPNKEMGMSSLQEKIGAHEVNPKRVRARRGRVFLRSLTTQLGRVLGTFLSNWADSTRKGK